MYMIIHLYHEKYLQDLILCLTEVGVEDCIVLSGESLGHKLVFDIPLFATFKDTVGSQRGYGNIIMGIAEKEDIDLCLSELKHAGINFIDDGLGKIYLIPISEVYE
ncbi:MAG: hypothetical protein PHY08_07210 [Candidatus Cloacimonetes bacterium]|nr:hypothetical protein [Candidatus Cloacimonadota bacterium]MDD4156348.1 hypothetical protein [Candidatus Cloacimonadota bacterium]